jgi:hypothetical protein
MSATKGGRLNQPRACRPCVREVSGYTKWNQEGHCIRRISALIPATMETISPQTLRYVDETPGFKDAVIKAADASGASPSVTVTLADFDDDPIRLYACLEFARMSGVAVHFAAPQGR